MSRQYMQMSGLNGDPFARMSATMNDMLRDSAAVQSAGASPGSSAVGVSGRRYTYLNPEEARTSVFSDLGEAIPVITAGAAGFLTGGPVGAALGVGGSIASRLGQSFGGASGQATAQGIAQTIVTGFSGQPAVGQAVGGGPAEAIMALIRGTGGGAGSPSSASGGSIASTILSGLTAAFSRR